MNESQHESNDFDVNNIFISSDISQSDRINIHSTIDNVMAGSLETLREQLLNSSETIAERSRRLRANETEEDHEARLAGQRVINHERLGNKDDYKDEDIQILKRISIIICKSKIGIKVAKHIRKKFT